MDKKSLGTLWDQVRQRYGVYLRLIESIPGDQYHAHPFKGMRSAAELVAHVSGGIIRDIPQGVARGEIKSNDAGEANTARSLASSADAVAFARRCWKEADSAITSIDDAHLNGMVKAWGSSMPGSVCMHILSDELLHHRGQLYVYARALGGSPPFVWGFADNAPEFTPRA